MCFEHAREEGGWIKAINCRQTPMVMCDRENKTCTQTHKKTVRERRKLFERSNIAKVLSVEYCATWETLKLFK